MGFSGVFKLNTGRLLSKSRCILYCADTSIDEELRSLLMNANQQSALSATDVQRLKTDGKLRKWESTLIEPSRLTSTELQQLTRTSFSVADYFQDIILKGALKSKKESNETPIFIAITSAGFLFSSLVLPQLQLDSTTKNILGLSFLFGPFLFVGVEVLAPGLSTSAVKSALSATSRPLSAPPSSLQRYSMQQERIAYHEAGHFLAGYLCGIPILEYSLAFQENEFNLEGSSSQTNAGTALLASVPTLETVILEIQRKNRLDSGQPSLRDILRVSKTGSLLITSMAGMVAETLRFGDCNGGREDLPLARRILRSYGVPDKQLEEYLRWAVAKALALLRLNRDALEAVAEAMLEGADVAACVLRIEAAS